MNEFNTSKENIRVERTSGTASHYDVIVIGMGSMGSAAAYYIAKSGASVLGLEQYDIPHEMGSHAGQSRIIRKAYFEHPDYVPLLERAYENWKDLEKITGSQVMVKTGLLYVGHPHHPLITGVTRSADRYQIPVETLNDHDMRSRYPQVNIPTEYQKLYEPDAGFVTPERAILLYTDLAIAQGAVVRTKTAVTRWQKKGKTFTVHTTQGDFHCQKLVICAGPWTSAMVPALHNQLQVTRQVVAWVIPRKPALFELGNWPCWMIADEGKPGLYYGFPILPPGQFHGPVGFKIAHHTPGQPCEPGSISRIPAPEDEANLRYCLDRYFPDGYAQTHVMKTCMYTNTPDENFIIDYLPGYDHDVTIAAGFSGHGFKFVSVVGEIIKDLLINGSTNMPIGFLQARRFQ